MEAKSTQVSPENWEQMLRKTLDCSAQCPSAGQWDAADHSPLVRIYSWTLQDISYASQTGPLVRSFSSPLFQFYSYPLLTHPPRSSHHPTNTHLAMACFNHMMIPTAGPALLLLSEGESKEPPPPPQASPSTGGIAPTSPQLHPSFPSPFFPSPNPGQSCCALRVPPLPRAEHIEKLLYFTTYVNNKE